MEVVQGKTWYKVTGPGFFKKFDNKKEALAVEENIIHTSRLIGLLERLEDDNSLLADKYTKDGILVSVRGTYTVDNSYCCVGPSSYEKDYTLDVKETLQKHQVAINGGYAILKQHEFDIKYSKLLSEEFQDDIRKVIVFYEWLKKTYNL